MEREVVKKKNWFTTLPTLITFILNNVFCMYVKNVKTTKKKEEKENEKSIQ